MSGTRRNLVVVAVLTVATAIIGASTVFAQQTPSAVPLMIPVSSNGTDLILSWMPVGADIHGNPITITNYNVYCTTTPTVAPDLSGHTNLLGSTNGTSFVVAGALTNNSNSFYYISAVDTNGSESIVFTNLVANLVLPVNNPAGTNVFAWLALPSSVPCTNASSLASLLGITGKLYCLNDTNQCEEVWDASSGAGTNFPVVAGASYAIECPSNTVLQIYGTYGTVPMFNWQYYTNQFNHHWISVPPNSIYSNAATLAADIAGCTKVAQFDTAAGQFNSWFSLSNLWTGTNFPLNPAQGLIISINSNTVWQPKPSYPQVTVNLQAGAGFIGLTSLQATGTVVAGAAPIVEYAWDEYGDGSMVTSNANPMPLLSLSLTNAMTIYPTYRVQDANGFYAVGSAPYAALSMSLSFTNQSFRPGLGETGTVSYTSSSGGYFSAYIYDASNNLVAVLESNVWQQAGTATLQWNGENLNGAVVPSGVYYAVINQTVNGATASYDPRPLLLNSNITTSVTGITVQNQFDAYTGGLFPIQYTLPTPSQVTIVILDASDNIIAVVCSNALQSAGTQVQYWNGQLSNGSLIPSGRTFHVGLTAVAIGANAMIVQQPLPSLTDLQSSATKFTPSSNPYGLGTNSVTLSYTLDYAADARIIVTDSQGNVVLNALDPGKSPGQNTSIWTGTDSLGRLVAAGIYNIAVAPEVSGQDGAPQTIWVQTYY
jgi:flagellar hook assembly protein FlgD